MFISESLYAVNNEGIFMGSTLVPAYYNFAWVPHTFGDLTHADPLISHTGLSYGIKMWAEVSFVLSQFTRLTDGQTDGQFSLITKTV